MEGFPYLESKESIQSYLESVAGGEGVGLDDLRLATTLDNRDKLASFRAKFCLPTISDICEGEKLAADSSQDCVYLTGNSLGLQPKGTKDLIVADLDKWAKKGVYGHFHDPVAWLPIEDIVVDESARLVGAKPIEVVPMNGLTVNCHLAMVSFYQPTKDRFKIVLEKDSFPSDFYAVQSQVNWHGYDPKEAMIVMAPREGEHFWRTEDVVQLIEEQGDSVALVWLPGVHYLTGYVFDMEAITKAAHSKGCYVGFDLAHAAGNVELCLHDWGVDVAAWCTYKYLNSGPGGIAGFFVHEKHAHNQQLPRLLGWWSHNRKTRFDMSNVLDLQAGAAGFQLSNPPVLECLSLKASLDVFADTSMRELTIKSRILTGYLEMLIEHYLTKEKRENVAADSSKYMTIVTPSDPKRRGAQLSLQFSFPVKEVHHQLASRGVVTDLRKDGHMRVAPAPLYNSFKDVWTFFKTLELTLK
ncbi:kynureninase-like isoform X2 [Halichondria panicea]|uniref:kynureninase-like isoform X2 n=1 Tax=Halichondria panicea TaxID=6063 RepID=UPI00312BA8C3